MEEILAQLKAIVDGAEAAERALTDEEVTEYEALEADLVRARKSAEIVKRTAAYGTVVSPRVNFGTKDVDDHVRAFDTYLRSGDKASMAQYRAQSESVGSAGGFLVPVQFQNKLTEHLKAFGGLMAASENITTADGAPLYWLTNDDVLSTEAEITAENALWSTGADQAFGVRTLNAFKYTSVGASTLPLKVSYELLQDSAFDIQSFIARKFAERIARKVAVDLISGSGVSEPQGIISTQGALTNSAVTLAAATPTYSELVSIIHSLDPAYRSGASWLFNDDTMARIEKVLDTTGRPLMWNTNMDMAGGEGRVLLGYPIVIDQAMPTIASGSNKGIVFGNLRDAYIVRQVKGFTMVVLNELYAQNGQVGFMGWQRLDGMVQDPFSAVYATSVA